MPFKSVLISMVLALLPVPVWGQENTGGTGEAASEPPSLAELAEREEERRSGLTEAGPVITNIDLARIVGDMRASDAPATVSEVDPEQPSEDSDVTGDDPGPAEPDEDELLMDEIREALLAARQEVVTASNSYMVLELRINNLRNQLYQEADPQRQQMLQRELAIATDEIREARATEAEARRNLDQMMSEALKAGMLPGELREIVGQVPVTRSSATID